LQNIHSERTIAAKKTLLLRALTPVETAHAPHADDRVAADREFARYDSARGKFFRITDAKVSHFFDLSVATRAFVTRMLNFFSNVRLISRGRTLIA
jgi:hypothetical protein